MPYHAILEDDGVQLVQFNTVLTDHTINSDWTDFSTLHEFISLCIVSTLQILNMISEIVMLCILSGALQVILNLVCLGNTDKVKTKKQSSTDT